MADRAKLLMMPNVTVELRPKGLPMAIAHAPAQQERERSLHAAGAEGQGNEVDCEFYGHF